MREKPDFTSCSSNARYARVHWLETQTDREGASERETERQQTRKLIPKPSSRAATINKSQRGCLQNRLLASLP